MILSTSLFLMVSRFIGLSLILSLFYMTIPNDDTINMSYNDGAGVYYNVTRMSKISCGKHNNITSQLRYTTWIPYESSLLTLPLYTTHDLDVIQPLIKNAVIIQHGNLRNGNDYFCSCMNALKNATAKLSNGIMYADSTICIAPHFLIDTDVCWDDNGIVGTVNVNAASGLPIHTCNHYIWSYEGWKDGEYSVNEGSIGMYSYDVYNHIVNRLGNIDYFPALKNITFFGFSAGGQTMTRYSMLPKYNEADRMSNKELNVKYIVSDPSTFLYFDNRRPVPTTYNPVAQVPKVINSTTYRYDVPTPDWIAPWTLDLSNTPWLSDWDSQCCFYNNWRYGFKQLTGYFAHHLEGDGNKIAEAIEQYRYRNVVFLLGLNDTANCKVYNSNTKPVCDDDELATYCSAMLQGHHRVDRMLKYKAYLSLYYGTDVHRIVYAPGISHEPYKMLLSVHGLCLTFNIC